MNTGIGEGEDLGSNRVGARITGAVIVAVALAILVFGGIVRPGRMGSFFQATSPGLLPGAVLLALLICGLALLVRPDSVKGEDFSWSSFGHKVAALLYLFAYTSLLPILGWFVASLGLLLTLPLLAGYRKPLGIAAAAALVLGSIWMVFVVGIDAPLP